MRSGRHNYYYVFTDRMHDASRSLILAWVLSLLVACGGGGGGGGGGSPPPTSAGLSYPSGAQTFVVGTAITAITPTITGTLTSFTISPTLPTGLSLDGGKGTISGTPTAISAATTYTVSASGAGGASATASVSITVNDVPPSAVTYGTSSYSYTANLPASTLNPKSFGGAVVSWSINPALPAGLNFSTTNGSISGTPTAASASTSYVVTAQNSGGQSTVTLTIAVSAAPLIHLGHQANVNVVRVTATNVLSADTEGDWILWDYTGASIVAYGVSGCAEYGACSLLSPAIDLAGTTAVIVTPTGFEVHATSDGHTLGTIAISPVNWWKLATDGSYIAAGSTKGVSAWSPSGQLLFTNPGDYSQAVTFATPGQLLIGAGAAGANVIETIAVPSGTSTTGPQFNGTFASWFTDGGRFITVAGTTVLVYSGAGVQQGTFTGVTGVNAIQMAGQGNWLWICSGIGASVLNVYPATGTNPAPAATYTFSATASPEPTASGLTIGVQDASAGSAAVSVIDLSGATPVRTDYPGSAGLQLVTGGSGAGAPYAAVSASQWVFGSGTGVVVDGATLASTPRYFGLGAARSISGGSGHFAIATALGNILYFNASTLAQEGQIAFTAVHLQSSTDGTVLAAGFPGVSPVQIYSLPAGNLLYSWTTAPQDFDLSGSGTVLGQVLYNQGSTPGQLTQEAAPATGGSSIFSTSITSTNQSDETPPLRISPDGTLIAYSQVGSPAGSLGPYVGGSTGTNLLLNGTLVTAVLGLTVGWLDNSRLLVNNYVSATPGAEYSGCALFGANGMATGGACALQFEVERFQPVTSDGIYVPLTDQILSVSTGNVVWKSADPFIYTGPTLSLGAVAGANVIFISGIDVLAQTFN